MSALHPFFYSDPALSITCQYLGPIEEIERFAKVMPEQQEKESLYALLKLVGNLNPLAYHNQTELLLPNKVLAILKNVASSLRSTKERSLNPLELRLNKIPSGTLQHAETLRLLFSELVKGKPLEQQDGILTCASRLRIPLSFTDADKAYSLISSEYKEAAISPAERDTNNVQNIGKRLQTMQIINNRIDFQLKESGLNDNWNTLLTTVRVQIQHLQLHLRLQSFKYKIQCIKNNLTTQETDRDLTNIRSLCEIRTSILTAYNNVRLLKPDRNRIVNKLIELNMEALTLIIQYAGEDCGGLQKSVNPEMKFINEKLEVLEKPLPHAKEDIQLLHAQIDKSISNISEIVSKLKQLIKNDYLNKLESDLETLKTRYRSLIVPSKEDT